MDKQTWLKEKLYLYGKCPEETVNGVFRDLLDTVDQYLANPESRAAKGLLELAAEMTRKFLKEVTWQQ